MASTRKFLIDSSTRHAIYLNRFAGSQLKEVTVFLEEALKITKNRLKNRNLSKLSRKRLNQTLASLEEELAVVYNRAGRRLTKNMKDLAVYEAEFATRMFNTSTGDAGIFKKPANSLILASVFIQPIELTDDSLGLESTLRQFSVAKRKELVNTIKGGVIQGRTDEEIVKDLEFVTRKVQKNHARALTRTITNHVSTAARQLTIDSNEDVIAGVEWVSTLDGSTTSTCQSLDGQVFPKGEGPRPPLHWGCRSTVVPVVKKEHRVFDNEDRKRPSVGASGPSTVKGNTTYQSWLKSQPRTFQEEVLGVSKAKLFREGKLPLSSFVDKNYQPLTLKQLKRKEPLAFERAGLNEED